MRGFLDSALGVMLREGKGREGSKIRQRQKLGCNEASGDEIKQNSEAEMTLSS